MNWRRKSRGKLAYWLALALAAVALPAVAWTWWRAAPSAQATQRAAAPPAPTRGVMTPQALGCAVWRTGGGMVSKLHLQNALTVAPLPVSITLYMEDGTPMPLPSVTLPLGGEATVNLNQAIAAASRAFTGQVSAMGSATLSYMWDGPGHLAASMNLKDTVHSLSFSQPCISTGGSAMNMAIAPNGGFERWEMEGVRYLLRSARRQQPTDCGNLSFHGLWWRRDSGVRAFFTLTNLTGVASRAGYRIIGRAGEGRDWQTVDLPPHSIERFEVAKVADLGGIEVQAPPGAQPGDLAVAGWLVNRAEGYSANIEFHADNDAAAGTCAPAAQTLAAAGVMVGMPMAMNHFPDGVRFIPYGYVQNTTSRAMDLSLNFNLSMGGGMAATAPMATLGPLPVRLAPGEARRIPLPELVERLQRQMSSSMGEEPASATGGLMLNWSASFTGVQGDLLLSTGAVDESGTYVFEVMPQETGVSAGKMLPYWNIAGANDTMYSIWNPNGAVQDVILTLTAADGKHHYDLPLRLAANASIMVDVKMLADAGMPDPEGNLLPASALDGSAVLKPAGMPKPGKDGVIVLPASGPPLMNVVVSMGVFNVLTATCCTCCTTCCDYSNPQLIIPAAFTTIGNTENCAMTVESCDGGTMNCSASTTWTGGNGVLTNEGGGVFKATAVGQATLSASDFLVAAGRRNNCCDTCPENQLSASNTAAVDPGLTITMGLNGSSPSGAGISGSTQNIVIGQQVQLQANYNLTGGTLTSQAWSVQGTTASQWTPGSNPTPISTGNNLTTIYWTAPGNGETATFTLNYNDANGSPQVASGSVNFNAAGPTAVVVTAARNYWIITSGALQFGNPLGPKGITFSATANAPSGATNTFTWAQILTSLSATCTLGGTKFVVPEPATPGLDNSFPYPADPGSASDSPGLGLFSGSTDVTDSIGATMYVLWNPGLTSDLRVPLGSVSWSASGHAAMVNGSWQVQGDSNSANAAFMASSTYPTWSGTISNGNFICGGSTGPQTLLRSKLKLFGNGRPEAWTPPGSPVLDLGKNRRAMRGVRAISERQRGL